MNVLLGLAGVIVCLTGCTSKPLLDYSTDTPPMILTPGSQAGLIDGRARFREIFCAINEERGESLPHYRPCDESLSRLIGEGEPTGRPVNLGASRTSLTTFIVPGVGWNCIKNYIDTQFTAMEHVSQFGYSSEFLEVEALSSTKRNTQIIHDAILARPESRDGNRLVLFG